jgi:hypothetical protein
MTGIIIYKFTQKIIFLLTAVNRLRKLWDKKRIPFRVSFKIRYDSEIFSNHLFKLRKIKRGFQKFRGEFSGTENRVVHELEMKRNSCLYPFDDKFT